MQTSTIPHVLSSLEVDAVLDVALGAELRPFVNRRDCQACEGDGELGDGAFGELAWCIACHGTGIADHDCEGCGEPTALDTLDHAPLDCVGVIVHATCDTGHDFFDRRPKPEVWR